MRKRHAFSSAALRAGLPLVGCVALGSAALGSGVVGCSSGSPPEDKRFSAQTNDEYGQEVVILAPSEPAAAGPVTSTDAGVGPSFDGGGPTGAPSGFWHFDDCSPSSPFLLDATGNGATAQHPIHSTCAPGISGQAVAIHGKKDMVQIADEPQFTVSDRIAVAAWVNPTRVDGDQPIVLKRLNSTTSFSLGIHGGNAEFSVVLDNGKTVRSRAPIDPNVWTHVGGFYDGHFLFLFLNGQQVGQVSARGLLRNVNAPVRIGATSQTQYMDGLIDEVWISTNPVTGTDIAALSCIPHAPTIAVSPNASGPVAPDTPFHYAVTVTDNDTGTCQPTQFFLQIPDLSIGGGGGGADAGVVTGPTTGPVTGDALPADAGVAPVDASLPDASIPPPPPPTTSLDGISIFANPNFSGVVSPGGSFTFDVSVTGSEDADPGVRTIPFTIFSFTGGGTSGSVDFELQATTGCRVNTGHELMMRDTSIVDDPVRTSFDSPVGTAHRGAWTFGRLMRDMAPTADTAPAFTERLFQTWLQNQTVNGFTIQARPAIQQIVLGNWPRTADGALDLDRSPLRLLAVVNRLDLRDLSKNSAGEGRFVFGVVGPGGSAEQFTVILEYRLGATSAADIQGWADAWHALATHPFPSEEYNVALEALTSRFSGRGAAPERPNGSGLDQLRTNEISLVPRWELRQFGLSASTGFLEPRPIDLTPDLGFNGSPALGRFVNQNEASIIAEQFTVPPQFEGAPFLAGSVFNDLVEWSAPGIADDDARFHLSLNTCNGCHGPETNTTFLQISPRFPGQMAALSPFLTGTNAFDQTTGQSRALNDLARRNTDLKALVCASSPAPSADAGAPPRALAARVSPTAATPTLTKGINRVH